jgi:hypothetical protein
MTRKRGPKTRWERQQRYLKSRDLKRLKQTQVAELMAAATFAGARRKPLNAFLTVTFSTAGAAAHTAFQRAVTRLRRLLRSHGNDLHWIYVWEAVGGPHIHALLHIPAAKRPLYEFILESAFAGHDVMLLTRRKDHFTYMCKGADYNTFRRIRGTARTHCSKQGAIPWKRCGTSLCLGRKARAKAGFGLDRRPNNCAETRTAGKLCKTQVWKLADGQGCISPGVTTYVELWDADTVKCSGDVGTKCSYVNSGIDYSPKVPHLP